MAPQYKLYYFDLMGLAEPIRLILAYANVEYEDIRLDRKTEWPDLKPKIPWGKLPVLQFPDGEYLCQSQAIINYLARKYNLIGETDREAAKCDEYAGVLVDLRQQEIVKHFNAPNPEAKAEIEKRLLDEVLPKCIEGLLEIMKKNGTGFLVGKKLTYVDIFLAFMIGQIRKTVKADYLEGNVDAEKYIESVLNQPGIKEWVAKRPNTVY